MVITCWWKPVQARAKASPICCPPRDMECRNQRRVVIATNTIALQDQLMEKDIPQVQALLPTPPAATLLKGRNNYLCLRRLHSWRTNHRLWA